MTKTKQHITSTTLKALLLKFLCIAFLLLGSTLKAQVTTHIDTTLIRIGEEITYTIGVEADSTALVLFPEGQSFQPLEVIDSYDIDTTRLETTYQLVKKYGLTKYDSGYYRLPSQRIVIDDRAFMTDSALVEVRDVPVDTTKQKMFDIKPAFEVDSPALDFVKILFWLVPLLVIGVIAYLLFRRKKRREEREKQLPPYEEAMEALYQLDGAQYLLENKSKAYYSSLTEIVKRYLDREVDDMALESTSDELIERLQLHKDAGHFDFDNQMIQRLDAIFKRADLVKFAKMKEESGQARADRSTIEEIINETKEAIPEPTEEELLENEAYLEAYKKKQQRNKWVKVTGIFLLVAAVTIGVNGAIKGFDGMWENLVGSEMKDLLESRWYKSEYGNPAVIIETPEILVRKDFAIPEDAKGVILATDYFEYGTFTDAFYISVSTSATNPELVKEGDTDLEVTLEGALQRMENEGAINVVVKKEQFSTEEGIKGLKAEGDFNLKLPSGKISKDKVAYEILLFSHNNGIQHVSIIYKKEDFNALSIKERIINSVELELQEPGQNQTKKEE